MNKFLTMVLVACVVLAPMPAKAGVHISPETGSVWSDDMQGKNWSGLDSKGNYWTLNWDTCQYYNYGTGETRTYDPITHRLIWSSKTGYVDEYGVGYGVYFGKNRDNTAIYVAIGAVGAVVLAALIWHAVGAPGTEDKQILKALEKYRYYPPKYTDKELEQIRRDKISAKLATAGIEIPANMAVAELQDMNGRVRLSSQLGSMCGKFINWRQYSLRQLNEMWIEDKCN